MSQARSDSIVDELPSGREYLDSLRDSRAIYLYGEKVRDVVAHAAFRNSARSIARLYDALVDPAQRELFATVDRLGIRTHRFFSPGHSSEELFAARDAIAAWSRLTYGFMGRTPDYKAAFMATLGANPEFYAPYDDNARRWYRQYAAKALYLNHVLVDPPVDRNRPVHEVADVYLHVVRETDAGAIVSGAKMLATGAALTHATFVASFASCGRKSLPRRGSAPPLDWLAAQRMKNRNKRLRDALIRLIGGTGLHATERTRPDRVRALIRSLRPVKGERDLIRLGRRTRARYRDRRVPPSAGIAQPPFLRRRFACVREAAANAQRRPYTPE